VHRTRAAAVRQTRAASKKKAAGAVGGCKGAVMSLSPLAKRK
jgi:hypothetical protein